MKLIAYLECTWKTGSNDVCILNFWKKFGQSPPELAGEDDRSYISGVCVLGFCADVCSMWLLACAFVWICLFEGI